MPGYRLLPAMRARCLRERAFVSVREMRADRDRQEADERRARAAISERSTLDQRRAEEGPA